MDHKAILHMDPDGTHRVICICGWEADTGWSLNNQFWTYYRHRSNS